MSPCGENINVEHIKRSVNRKTVNMIIQQNMHKIGVTDGWRHQMEGRENGYKVGSGAYLLISNILNKNMLCGVPWQEFVSPLKSASAAS